MKTTPTLATLLLVILGNALEIPGGNNGIAGHDLDARTAGSVYGRDKPNKVPGKLSDAQTQSRPATTGFSLTCSYNLGGESRVRFPSFVTTNPPATLSSGSRYCQALPSPTYLATSELGEAKPTGTSDQDGTVSKPNVVELKARSTGPVHIRSESSHNNDKGKGKMQESNPLPSLKKLPTNHPMFQPYAQYSSRRRPDSETPILKTTTNLGRATISGIFPPVLHWDHLGSSRGIVPNVKEYRESKFKEVRTQEIGAGRISAAWRAATSKATGAEATAPVAPAPGSTPTTSRITFVQRTIEIQKPPTPSQTKNTKGGPSNRKKTNRKKGSKRSLIPDPNVTEQLDVRSAGPVNIRAKSSQAKDQGKATAAISSQVV